MPLFLVFVYYRDIKIDCRDIIHLMESAYGDSVKN